MQHMQEGAYPKKKKKIFADQFAAVSIGQKRIAVGILVDKDDLINYQLLII